MKIIEFDSRSYHRHGTIATLRPTEECAKSLYEWCNSNNITCIDPEKLHCTVLFSKEPVEHLVAHNNKKIVIEAKILGWKKLGYALTLELDAPRAHKLHKYMIDQGGTHDYPEFIAHTSVTYDWPQQDLPSATPDFPLVFDRLKVTPIDPDFAD